MPGATTVKLAPDDEIKRVILCSGKVYFDLMEEREKREREPHPDAAPRAALSFPGRTLAAELKRFPSAEVVWCQEEPKNQGAWTFVARGSRRSTRKSGAMPLSALYRAAGICLHRAPA